MSKCYFFIIFAIFTIVLSSYAMAQTCATDPAPGTACYYAKYGRWYPEAVSGEDDAVLGTAAEQQLFAGGTLDLQTGTIVWPNGVTTTGSSSCANGQCGLKIPTATTAPVTTATTTSSARTAVSTAASPSTTYVKSVDTTAVAKGLSSSQTASAQTIASAGTSKLDGTYATTQQTSSAVTTVSATTDASSTAVPVAASGTTAASSIIYSEETLGFDTGTMTSSVEGDNTIYDGKVNGVSVSVVRTKDGKITYFEDKDGFSEEMTQERLSELFLGTQTSAVAPTGTTASDSEITEETFGFDAGTMNTITEEDSTLFTGKIGGESVSIIVTKDGKITYYQDKDNNGILEDAEALTTEQLNTLYSKTQNLQTQVQTSEGISDNTVFGMPTTLNLLSGEEEESTSFTLSGMLGDGNSIVSIDETTTFDSDSKFVYKTGENIYFVTSSKDGSQGDYYIDANKDGILTSDEKATEQEVKDILSGKTPVESTTVYKSKITQVLDSMQSYMSGSSGIYWLLGKENEKYAKRNLIWALGSDLGEQIEDIEGTICSGITTPPKPSNTISVNKYQLLPSIQLQASRSSVIKYPEYYNEIGTIIHPEGISIDQTASTDLYFYKITFIVSGEISDTNGTFEIALTGKSGGSEYQIDLNTEDNETETITVEAGTGISAAGSGSVMKYWPVLLDNVCLKLKEDGLIFVPEIANNPAFKDDSNGYLTFCVPVVIGSEAPTDAPAGQLTEDQLQ